MSGVAGVLLYPCGKNPCGKKMLCDRRCSASSTGHFARAVGLVQVLAAQVVVISAGEVSNTVFFHFDDARRQ